MYNYRALLERVIDGDSCILRIDLGFRVWIHERFRLLGIDTPEPNAQDPAVRTAAIAAKQFLESRLAGQRLFIRSEKLLATDRYSGWLGMIWREDSEVSVNEQMIEAGHGRRV